MSNTQVSEESTKRSNPFGAALDRFFHISERGGTIASEIGAGLAACLIAVASLIMNTQIIGASYGSYAGAYCAVTLLSFIGTLVMGLLFNRPIVQIANMATSSVMISLLGVYEGLTYSNLLMIEFISALLYLALLITPIGETLFKIIPTGVKKAIPIGVGLFTIVMGLKNAGIVAGVGSLASGASLSGFQKYIFVLLFLAVAAYIILKALQEKKALFRVWGVLVGVMWAGGILFYLSTFVGGSTAAVIVYERLNVIAATDGASPYNIGLGFASIQWGELFSQGGNFTALVENGGNPALVVIQGVLTFLALNLFGNMANLHAVAASGNYLSDDDSVEKERTAYLVSAGLNVIAPILGASPLGIGSESAIESDDEGKSGLSSVVASLGFFVALFTWIVPALSATKTSGVGMWINDSEVKLAAYVNDVFAFSDIVMVFVGASMLKGVKNINVKDLGEFIPFVVTIASLAFSGNFGLAIAGGILAHGLVSLAMRKWDNFKLGNIILDASCLVYLILALC